MSHLIAVDPGKYKCGMVLVDIVRNTVIDGRVVLANEVVQLIKEWDKLSEINFIVLGNGTTSKYWNPILSEFALVNLVDENGSSLRARKRYWELFPPSRFLFWLPKSLLLPSENIDAVAALIILEDHLGKKLSWTGSKHFKI